MSDPGWSRSIAYEHDTLITEVTLGNPEMSLRLVCRDAVDFHESLFEKQIAVDNQAEEPRRVRLLFAHDLHIGAYEVDSSAYYEPERRAVFHSEGPRW